VVADSIKPKLSDIETKNIKSIFYNLTSKKPAEPFTSLWRYGGC